MLRASRKKRGCCYCVEIYRRKLPPNPPLLPLVAETPAVIRFLEKIFHAWTHTVSSNCAEKHCSLVLFCLLFFSVFFFPSCGTFSCCFLTTQSSRGDVTGNMILSLLIGAATLLAAVSRGSFAPRRKISLSCQFWKNSFRGNKISPVWFFFINIGLLTSFAASKKAKKKMQKV